MNITLKITSETSERKCGDDAPTPDKGMDISWPHRKKELGDEIIYTCPNGKLTWEEKISGKHNSGVDNDSTIRCSRSICHLYLAQTIRLNDVVASELERVQQYVKIKNLILMEGLIESGCKANLLVKGGGGPGGK